MRTKLPAGGEAISCGWLHKFHLLQTHNIGHRNLELWVSQGLVRSVKLDPSKQGRRLYNVGDVVAVLNALSSGKEPKRVAGRGGAV